MVTRKHDTIARFARTLDGVNSNATKRDLLRANFRWKTRHGHYRVYSQFRDKLFVEKLNAYTGDMDIFLTEAGRSAMVRLYQQGRLTMKAGSR
ncbi:MAG: hypothetical protein JO251_00235 [Verrucomicrobia bacterium]|nr:hypothetical protein [Verrucomicrobiota bacterium]